MLPYSMENIDEFAGRYQPNTRMINSRAFWFWVRAFFGRAISVIDFNNLIPEWDDDTEDTLYYWLYINGFVGVFDTDKYGLIFQFGNLNGRDIYYRPANFQVANAIDPSINKNYSIEKEECAVLKLTPTYCGIYDIIQYYAEKAAMLDNDINVSLENLKLTKVVTAKNKAAAETLKKIVDLANAGQSLVVTDKLLPDDKDGNSPLNIYDLPNIKNSYVLSDQLHDMKTIIDMFDAEIGIPTLLNDKRERLVSSEADYSASSARAAIWVRTLNKSFNKINKLYGTNMSASLHYQYNQGGVNNGDNEINGDSD